MRSRPSALRDFTVDRRTWMLCAVASSLARRSGPCSAPAARDCTGDEYFLLPSRESRDGRTRLDRWRRIGFYCWFRWLVG